MWMRYGEPLLAAMWDVEGGEGAGMLQAEPALRRCPRNICRTGGKPKSGVPLTRLPV
jgi:hypothetical protein